MKDMGYGDKGAFKRFKGRPSQSNLQKIKIKLYPSILFLKPVLN